MPAISCDHVPRPSASRTRTATIFTLQHNPAMPRSLLPRAPMIPATCVPWPCLSSPEPLPSTRSPPKRSSTTPLSSSSRPLDGSLVFSHRLPLRSGWLVCTPVSSTATFAQLVRSFQAPGASMSWSSFCLIAYCSLTPGSLAFLEMAIGPSSSTRCTRSLLRSRARRSSRLTPSRGRDRERADQTQPQRAPAAGVADDLFAARVARVRAELHEQARDRRLLPARLARAGPCGTLIAAAGEANPAIRTVTTPNTRRRSPARTKTTRTT